MSTESSHETGNVLHDPRLSLERALEQALALLAQKEAELSAVRRSEESYRSLVEKVMDFVFCIDREGIFTFVNSAVLPMLGYRAEELVGQHFLSILAEDSKAVALEHFHRNMEGRGPRVIYELVMGTKDGRRIPIEIHATNAYENGQVVGVRGIARDVSDRHHSEERQRHHFAELQTITQIGQQIASELDLDDLLPLIVQAIRKRPEYHYVNVFLKDETGSYMVLKATSGDYGYPLPIGTRLKIGEEGLVGWVAKSGKPLVANDVSKEPRYYPTRELQLTKSELTVPVKLGKQVVGVLDIESNLEDAFDDGDLQSAKTLADEIALALRNAELYEGEIRRREETAMILEITRAVNSTLLLDEVMKLAATSIGKAVGLPDCGMYLMDETGTKLLPQNADSPLTRILGETYTRTALEIGPSGFLREIVDTRKPVISPRADTDPRTNKKVIDAFGIKSLLGVPFVSRERVLGVAMVSSYKGYYDFQTDQVEVAAGIANSVALAIENARLYERTRELAVMEERNRLAREIHDTIAQGLTGIILQLEASDQLMDVNPEKARMRLQKATALARSSLQEARRSVWNLRPTPLEDRKLADAIGEELRRQADEASWETSCNVEGEQDGVSIETENGLYRIAQEALSNVAKHAQATRVDVKLSFAGGRVRLSVRDNGTGFDPTTARSAEKSAGTQGGFGLMGLRERARLLGGTLDINSAPGKGTLMQVEVPISR